MAVDCISLSTPFHRLSLSPSNHPIGADRSTNDTKGIQQALIGDDILMELCTGDTS